MTSSAARKQPITEMPTTYGRATAEEIKTLTESELRARIEEGRYGDVHSENRNIAESWLRHLEARRNAETSAEALRIAKRQTVIAIATLVTAAVAAVASIVGLFY